MIDPRHSCYIAEHIPDAKLVLVPGEDTLPFLGDSDAILGEVEEFLTGQRLVRDTDRLLATVLFTDIVGSTERAARWGTTLAELLAEHDRLVRGAAARHDGREVKTVGDGFVATFDGPARAVPPRARSSTWSPPSDCTCAPACTPGSRRHRGGRRRPGGPPRRPRHGRRRRRRGDDLGDGEGPRRGLRPALRGSRAPRAARGAGEWHLWKLAA